MSAGIAAVAIDRPVAVACDRRLPVAADVRIIFPAAGRCGTFRVALGQRICHPEGGVMSGIVAVIVVTRLTASEAVVDISGLLCRQFQQANLFRRCRELVHIAGESLDRGRLVSRSLDLDIGLIVVCRSRCKAAQTCAERCAVESACRGVVQISRARAPFEADVAYRPGHRIIRARQGYPCLTDIRRSVGSYCCCGLFTPVAADGWESIICIHYL